MQSTKKTMLLIAAGFAVLLVVGVLWAKYSLANPVAGPDYVVRLITFAMLAAGAAAIATLSTTPIVGDRKAWWRHALPIAAAAGVVMVFYQSSYMTDGGFVVLFRDVAASTIAVVLFTLSIAWFTRWLFVRKVAASMRSLVVLALTIPFALAVPYALLLVHCTSGNC